MDDLVEQTLGPEVVLRRGADVDLDIAPTDEGAQPLVSLVHGAVWVSAEPGSTGVDIGHGTLSLVLREGTALVDAQGGSGLVIVLRGALEISSGGLPVAEARAGDALTFDATGRVSDPDPVDATELARDPFVSLNLVLDALEGPTLQLAGDGSEGDPPEGGVFAPRPRGKGLFSRGRRPS